jgi:AraC family transcriptional regulator, regulatory protein of adaptative response / methylated-DNA-[protein]-cysteine methyltransferase
MMCVEVLKMALMTPIRPLDYSTIDEEACWEIAKSGDTSFDGVFVVAVRTTKVYCRPSCRVRPPLRKNVTFMESNEAAEAAGYRACKRCKPQDHGWSDAGPDLVARATDVLESEEGNISLQQLASILESTPGALNASFKRILGVTIQQFTEARRLERLKDGLRDGEPVTRAMYDAGYGSSSRLYEKASSRLGMTPGTYRKGGDGMTIGYQLIDSPAGRILVAATEHGVCAVRFGDTDEALCDALHAEFPRATISSGIPHLNGWVAEIQQHLDGLRPRLDVPLDVQGTAFQWRVWRALQDIALGRTKSYKEVAVAIGQPSAVRAVARACATNKVAVVIPCHRVIGSDGSLTGFASGIERKAALLAAEAEAVERAEMPERRQAAG